MIAARSPLPLTRPQAGHRPTFPAIPMTGETHRQTVAITNPSGFHMRPMRAFVEAAVRFAGDVTVAREGKPPVNGKSIWGLLGLVAEQGTELCIEVTGPNAHQVLQDLVMVLARNYDDEQEPAS